MNIKGIGIVFDIDALGGGFYGSKAWRLFMKTVSPSKILGCILREGDTNSTLCGSANFFCISVEGQGLDLDYVREQFHSATDAGFASLDRRFILSPQLGNEPLVTVGYIDSYGRLSVDEWDRIFHDRCKDCNWGYAPAKVPVNLSQELSSELRLLQDKKI